MTSVSFIFRYNEEGDIHYGKIILNHIDTGNIDVIIRPYIIKVLNQILENPINRIELGILGVSSELCSTNEMSMFTVYIIENLRESIDDGLYCYVEENNEYVAKYYVYGEYTGKIDRW